MIYSAGPGKRFFWGCPGGEGGGVRNFGETCGSGKEERRGVGNPAVNTTKKKRWWDLNQAAKRTQRQQSPKSPR